MKIDELISKLKEARAELTKSTATGLDMMAMTEKAEAGPNPSVIISKRPLKPHEVKDVGPASFAVGGVGIPRGQIVASPRHPMSEKTKKTEDIKFDKNGQWSMDKAEIYDFKSKKMLANLKPPKFTVTHTKTADNGSTHHYDIHRDGEKVGSAKTLSTGEQYSVKHKLPEEMPPHEVVTAKEAIRTAHEKNREKKSAEHLKARGIAGKIEPANFNYQRNVLEQHPKKKKTSDKKETA